MFVPTIKAKKMWIPEELKDTELVTEFLEELRFATGDGFKSKHDDVCDTASMLLDMEPFPPSQDAKPEFTDDEDGNHAFYNDYDDEIYNNSTVF